MFHQKIKYQHAGKPITARTINQIIGLLERVANIRVAAPLAMTDTGVGPQIYFAGGIGQLIPGTTGGGFAAGSPSSPTAVTTSCTIYGTEGTAGWSGSKTVTNAYSIYSGTIAASKTAWYWQSPNTGNYYVVTADC